MRISDWSSDVCSSDLLDDMYDDLIAPKRQAGSIPDDHEFALRTEPARRRNRVSSELANRVSPRREREAVPHFESRTTPSPRSEESRVGKECSRTCRSRWSQ